MRLYDMKLKKDLMRFRLLESFFFLGSFLVDEGKKNVAVGSVPENILLKRLQEVKYIFS